MWHRLSLEGTRYNRPRICNMKIRMEERIKGKEALIDKFKKELTEYKNRSEKAKKDQPKVIEELNSIKE